MEYFFTFIFSVSLCSLSYSKHVINTKPKDKNDDKLKMLYELLSGTREAIRYTNDVIDTLKHTDTYTY